ncbi:MAG: arginine--tRNA ligase [Chloroflexota bacterium]|nr:arginine--tRNA ligase [Chloroflexota bacterium]
MDKLLLKQKLAISLQQAVLAVQEQGVLAAAALPEIIIEHPQNPEHGDFASGLPLKLARSMKMPPMVIAQRIFEHISPPLEVDKVSVASPGFINFTLRDDWLKEQVEMILTDSEAYGNLDLGKGSRVQVEFVSANPTGPLHVGHGRGAVLGSTLANVLAAAGYSVQREYYVNDMGTQIDNFGRSLYARYQQYLGEEAAMPEEGYLGNYLVSLAEEIAREHGREFLTLPREEAVSELGKIGIEKMMAGIEEDLSLLRVKFDTWFSEKSLYQNGQYDKVMALLQNERHVAKKENATWFESSSLGEDKDNVLVRSDGAPTYFASDIAYHYDKFVERKFHSVIDIWGADHQGHIPRMKTVMQALGIDPEQLKIITYQLVTLRRGEEIVKVSKRSGDIVTLCEVIDEVGADACRFIFLSRSADSQMDFNIELAKRQSADNPVYYVQYAHARIASILRLAKQRGIDYSQGDISLLSNEPELTLIRRLVALPEIVEDAAATLQPHYLTYYAQDLATVFHSFYKQCRVVSGDEALTKARLKLVKATQIVLVKILGLMGMNAPESM